MAANALSTTLTEDDILAENLLRRGVPYLSGSAPDAPALDDVALAAGLASSGNARVRHALTAWMPARPGFQSPRGRGRDASRANYFRACNGSTGALSMTIIATMRQRFEALPSIPE